MKKITKVKFLIILIAIIFILIAIAKPVFADFGDFEGYSSGGSDWGGSSSWDSSSWGSSSGGSYDSGFGFPIFMFLDGESSWLGILIFLAIIGFSIWSKYNKGHNQNYIYNHQQTNTNTEISSVESKWAEEHVKAIDEQFNKEEFLTWVKDVFIKMQIAWMKRDLSTLRVFQTDALYEQSRLQVQGYIDRKQINMLERICIEAADLMKFRQAGNKDIMEVKLKSKMQDYIIEEETGKIVRGIKDQEIRSTYKLTFIRTTGVKTKPGESTLNTTNCPNCGAPTEISSSGKCEYCGSVITTGKFGWVLSNLEKIG